MKYLCLANYKPAFRLQPSGGKTAVTDSPFAEARELVGGFFTIEAASREEAIRIASPHPAATLGEEAGWNIDIHPVGFFEQYEEGSGQA